MVTKKRTSQPLRYHKRHGNYDSEWLLSISTGKLQQKYFLVLWLWWLVLAVISIIGLVYRLARMFIPPLSRYTIAVAILQNCSVLDIFLIHHLQDILEGSKYVSSAPNILQKC
jgi:hypothetical protein